MCIDLVSYLLGKKKGGGATPTLQTKSVTITENGTSKINADSGYDGLQEVNITTNVSGGGSAAIDWTDVGYSKEPDVISQYGERAHEIALIVAETFDEQPKTLNDLNNSLPNVTRFEIICYPNLDLGIYSKWLSNAFSSCYCLKYVPKQLLTTTNELTGLENLFLDCSSLGEVDVGNIVTDNVSTMSKMFSNCKTLKTIKGLSNFNTSNLTDMSYMFLNTFCINTIDLSSFDTRNVTNMQSAFESCKASHIDFGENFVLPKLLYMTNIFSSASNFDNDTVNSILHILTTATSYAGTKTLRALGFSSSRYPALTIQGLSNYQEFINAGWTIGY